MKAKHPFLISKAAIKNVLAALSMAAVSTTLLFLLMTLTSKMVYSSPSQIGSGVNMFFENEHCSAILTDDEFKIKRDLIAKKYFEETIVDMSKELMESYCLSSTQVKELMVLFSFDKTRMAFAEYAINRVVDPENFGVCKEAFAISSNKILIDDMVKQFQTTQK